jgi:hypothetical protein
MVTITISTDPQLPIPERQQLESALAALGFFPGEAASTPATISSSPVAANDAAAPLAGASHDGIRVLINELKSTHGHVGLDAGIKALTALNPMMKKISDFPSDPALIAKAEEALRNVKEALALRDAS